MIVLAALAVFSGLWNAGGGFSAFMGHEVHAPGFFGILAHGLPWISLIFAFAGILLAHAMYNAKWISADSIGRAFKPFYTLFLRRYYLDELYENIIVKFSLTNGLFAGMERIDTEGVDGAVNGAGGMAVLIGKGIRRLQTGQLQLYGLTIGIGIIAIILVVYLNG